jgi:farnesyl diphosphate synthase
MTFEYRFAENARLVDDWLDTRINDAGVSAPQLWRAMRYAALGAGKRLRPFLLIETAGIFGISPENALPAAGALECIHCYSLVHDDLPAMDDDDLRRGRPTVHRHFDEATAILAGDSLLTLAFEILSAQETHGDPAVRLELVQALAKASGADGMAGGQMLDLTAEVAPANLEDIRLIQSLKTGCLITHACQAGAILGHASVEQTAQLIAYAENIGLAFQIADDLLDHESSSDTIGKATQKDSKAGKATFVSLLGAKEARALAQRMVDQAIEAVSGFGAKAGMLTTAAQFAISREK